MLAQDRSGLVRVLSLLCASGGHGSFGSGFLIHDDLIVTSATLVQDFLAVAVQVGHSFRAAKVIGADSSLNVALLKLSKPLTGRMFAFSQTTVSARSDVASLGYAPSGGASVAAHTVQSSSASEVVLSGST